MRRSSLFLLFVLCLLLQACSDEEPEYVPEPVYTQITGVKDITSRTASITFKLNFPVTKDSSGMYIMDDKWLWKYGALYTTDTTQQKRLWLFTINIIPDASGSYTIRLEDLAPATTYYARSWVLTTKEIQAAGLWNESEETIEFETLPE